MSGPGAGEVKVALGYKIEFLSPFHVGTGCGLAGVVDSRTTRDRDGFVYIPGSSLKGRLKPYFERLVGYLFDKEGGSTTRGSCGGNVCMPERPCIACYLFGNLRWEGSLRFSDAKLSSDERAHLKNLFEEYGFPLHMADSEVRTSVRISRMFRTAEPKCLFSNELGRAGMHLYGSIYGRMGREGYVDLGPNSVPLGIPLLVAAIKGVEDLGGCNSRGLGRCFISVENILVKDLAIAPPTEKDIADILLRTAGVR